ncbi:MAG TPA: hypothetical protein VFU73_13690, partial [Actinocrinis sp.]|nr:hypothetical protein [Actinocrinis sp.]
MSTDTGEPSLWYQPPAGARSPAWPQNPLLGTVAPSTGNPGSYPARLGETEDAAPTFYYPDVLSAVPATLDDDVVRELSDGLSPLGMSLSRGPAFRAGSEVTLMLTAAPGTTDAPDAWQALQQLRALRGTPPLGPAASAAVDGLALRRLYMTGMPAKEGHGGADRAAVTLFAAPPARADASRVPGVRRPGVAVNDSGVRHPPRLTGADGDP